MLDAVAEPTDTRNADSPNPTPPVKLDTSNDYALVARACTNEADELKKLAEKNENAGYGKEARRIRQDANQIVDRIIPNFQPQTGFQFDNADDDLEDVIARQFLADIGQSLRAAAAQAKAQAKANQPPTEGDDLESIGTRLAKKLALRVAQFGHECAERGVWAGQAVREVEEGDVVRRATAKLAPPPAE
jgi:hypothetical protein